MTSPRPAATLMLLRSGISGALEVFMQRRQPTMAFPGVHAFPGGSVDPRDELVELDAVSGPLNDAQASQCLGVARGGLSYWHAALRECFEEVGVLIADGAELALDPTARRQRAELRAAVDAGHISMVDVCRRLGVTLRVESLAYVAHFVTPEGGSPKRFDARFFVAELPAGQLPAGDHGEIDMCEWITPTRALDRFHSGDLELIAPTQACLELLASFDAVDNAMAYLQPTDARAARLQPLYGGACLAPPASTTSGAVASGVNGVTR